MEKEQLVKLVTAAQNGDADAKSELFTVFYEDVHYFVLKTVKDSDLAADITQETFIEILTSLDKLKEPAAFVTWMKQIAYHQCTRYFRKKKDVIVDEDEDGGTIFDNLKEESSEFIPEEALDDDELKRTLLGMLDELSEEQRSAVILRYFDDVPVKDIAIIQGVSEGTVKSRLNYARKSLKKSADDYQKKTGIPLGAFSMFGLIRWLMADGAGSALSAAEAAALAEGVSAATGVTVSAATSAGAAAGAATAAGAAAGTVTTVTATAATAAATGITAKIVAGIVAAAIVIGGTTTAVILTNKDDPAPTITDEEVDVPRDEDTTATIPLLLNPDLSADATAKLFTHALNRYFGQTGHEFPTFSDVSELSADDMVIFSYPLMAHRADNTISTEGLKRTVYNIFGRELDLDSLTEASVTKSGEDYMFAKTPGTAYASVYSLTRLSEASENSYRLFFTRTDTNEILTMQLDKAEAYWHITLFISKTGLTTHNGQDELNVKPSYTVPEGATYVTVSGQTYRS
ncbi:MAG: sigma-70 family RNA polymerase sigma factor, partial [Clostridia bacterium]|nr:sigma-70 family RNA polymerase sigma factor [Clostridia bacterium]